MLERQSAPPCYDHFFITICILLTGAGLVTLYSASYAFSGRLFSDGELHIIKRQLLLAAGGFLMFFVFSRINIENIRRFIMILVIATMFLCLLPFFPGIGRVGNGAMRWINIGNLSLQPSELVKLILPLYLAHILDKKKDKLHRLADGIIPELVVVIIFFTEIFFQNNFSTAMFIVINAFVLFFLAGVRIRYFLSAVIIMIPVSLLLIMTKEYRLLRVKSFFRPEEDLLGINYQVHSAQITLESAGFWGKGLGQGIRKIASIPEVHSDFIFASFVEESGFLGVILFFLAFGFFAFRAYSIALNTDSEYKRLLVFGLTTSIMSQMFLNVAVVIGIVPTTGIPLPFFSAGGSSLAATLIACGIIANVSRANTGGPDERYDEQ